MTDSDDSLPPSPALGLWARHSIIMDELWEVDESTKVDTEAGPADCLIEFVQGKHSEHLARVFESAQLDALRLLNYLRDRLITFFESGDYRFRAEQAIVRDPWACRIRLMPQGARTKKRQITVELHVVSTTKSPDQALNFVINQENGNALTRERLLAWLRSELSRKGRRTGRSFPVLAHDDEHLDFGSTHVVLHRLKLNKFLKDGTLNMQKLAKTFLEDLKWLDARRREGLAQACAPFER